MRTALLLGLIAGIAAGLFYAWIVDPVKLTAIDPAGVEARYREVWIVVVAEAYQAGGDWPRAEMRLSALHDPNLGQTVRALFDRINTPAPNPTARALARLADRLGVRSTEMLIYLSTPEATSTSNAPTATPTRPATSEPSLTPTDSFPSPSPTATPTPEFSLVSSASVCQEETPQIRVTVQTPDGDGIPGVDVWITWDGGADRFVTGLKPELGSGYGDFDMQLKVGYRVGAGIQLALALVNNLRAEPCTTDAGRAGWRSWDIVLQPVAP